MKHAITTALAWTLLITTPGVLAAKGSLFGTWRLNNELTSDVQDTRTGPDLSAMGNVSTTVTVGGMPLPTGSGSKPPSGYDNIPSKDPDVLRCAELSIEQLADDVLLTYQGVGSETLSRGNVQGTRTSWSKSKLTSRYTTTSRKVSRTFAVQPDGRLLVTVKLNPNRAKAAVHKRIFDRVQ